jgi:hypothetical protein
VDVAEKFALQKGIECVKSVGAVARWRTRADQRHQSNDTERQGICLGIGKWLKRTLDLTDEMRDRKERAEGGGERDGVVCDVDQNIENAFGDRAVGRCGEEDREGGEMAGFDEEIGEAGSMRVGQLLDD